MASSTSHALQGETSGLVPDWNTSSDCRTRDTAMVTTTVKAVIDSNRSLLIRNVIPCDELYDNLAKLNVLPDTMLRDVKVCCDMT